MEPNGRTGTNLDKGREHEKRQKKSKTENVPKRSEKRGQVVRCPMSTTPFKLNTTQHESTVDI